MFVLMNMFFRFSLLFSPTLLSLSLFSSRPYTLFIYTREASHDCSKFLKAAFPGVGIAAFWTVLLSSKEFASHTDVRRNTP